MDDRYIWCDYAKAIGILLVVYGHVARGLYSAGIPMDPHWFQGIDSVIYSFHMPLFFFLSGLFFEQSLARRGKSQLICSKIDSIFYPYLVWSLLQGSIEVQLSRYTNGQVGWTEVFALLWQPRQQFWFLHTLFLMFVFLALIHRPGLRPLAWLWLCLSSLLYIFQADIPKLLTSNLLARSLVFFGLGLLFAQLPVRRRAHNPAALLVSLLAFGVGQYLFHVRLGLTFEDRGLCALLLALVSIWFICELSAFLARNPRPFWLLIGASSMGIYLMHILASSGMRIILKKMGVDNLALHLIGGMTIGIAGPLIALRLLPRLRLEFLLAPPQAIAVSHWWGSFRKRRLENGAN